MARTLLVFLKYPEPGSVKTRLAAAIGPARAAELYRQWIDIVLEGMRPLRGSTRIVACYDGAPREDFVEELLLVAEVIVHQRVMHTQALRHVLERDAVQAVLGEQLLGSIENLLRHFGALRRFGHSPFPGLRLLAFARCFTSRLQI